MSFVVIQPRRGTEESASASNPVLAMGERGYETDTKRWKTGDGVTNWNDLPYDGGSASIPDATTTGLAILTGTPEEAQDAIGASVSGKTVLTGTPTQARTAIEAAPAQTSTYYRRARTVSDTNSVDDKTAIQSILDEGAREVVFRSGQTWTVDATGAGGGLIPRSNTRIIIEEGATIQVKTNSDTHYRLFNIGVDEAVQNVTIEGAGTLLGDLETHTGTTGQYGHILMITDGAANVQVLGPMLIKHAWGDGIYIGGVSACKDILVDGVTVEDCRREGIAPFWVDGCTIRNCRVIDIGKTAVNPGPGGGPGSGIDVEPNASEWVSYLTLENNYVEGSAGCGIYVSANPGPVPHLIMRGNQVVDCGLSSESFTTYQTNGIHVSSVARPILLDNVVRGSGYDGNPNGSHGQIYLRGVTRPVVRGGYLDSGLGRGLYMSGCVAPEVRDVTVFNNMYHGILAYQCDGAIIRGNTVIDNVQSSSTSAEHISIQDSDNAVVQGNTVRGSKGGPWLAVETAGDDNLICNNTGLGAAPSTGMISDAGTRTVKHGNYRKDTSVFTPMSTDDGAVTHPSKSFGDLLGWTFDPATIISTQILPAAGTVYFFRIPLPNQQTITNIVTNLAVLGADLVNSFVALFKSDGTVLGQSTDQSSAWGAGGSTGLKTIALTSPVTVTPATPNDFVWAAIYVGAATTLPSFSRGVASNAAILGAGQGASRRRFASIAQASTATLASVTPSSMAAASHAFWLALS